MFMFMFVFVFMFMLMLMFMSIPVSMFMSTCLCPCSVRCSSTVVVFHAEFSVLFCSEFRGSKINSGKKFRTPQNYKKPTSADTPNMHSMDVLGTEGRPKFSMQKASVSASCRLPA
jgi:hypothetical protein